MPGESGVTVVTMLVCFVFYRIRGCGRIARPAFPAPSDWRVRKFLANLGRIRPRDREVVRSNLPSLHALLRVVGRGRGWGVYQLAPPAANLPRYPHPRPLPAASRVEGSRRSVAMARCLAGCLKFESVAADSVIPGWPEGPDPESRDSGFDASHRPGMTARVGTAPRSPTTPPAPLWQYRPCHCGRRIPSA
jgi:hypothetical protein